MVRKQPDKLKALPQFLLLSVSYVLDYLVIGSVSQTDTDQQ